METKLIITPDDTLWWILRPEFLIFVDQIVISSDQLKKEELKKDSSGYHMATWDRLNVLIDNGIVEIRDIEIDYDTIESKTDATLKTIFNPKSPVESIVDDAIFGYEYWIDFNKQKLELVPDDQDYYKKIKETFPIWTSDLNLLKSKRFKAFEENPDLIHIVVRNVIKKVHTLKHINQAFSECPLTGLKEYEPFMKYVEGNLDAPLVTDKTLVTYKNAIPNKLDGAMHLPVEPEYEFMRFKLSKLKFHNVFKVLFNNYKESRRKIKESLKLSEEIAFGLSEGRINQKFTEDYYKVNRELLNDNLKIAKNSKYLSYAFYGLSLIPILPISALFGLMGLSPNKLAEFADSSRKYFKGINPKGLSSYYAFNESIMDIKHLNKFPDIQKDNTSFTYDKEIFWRE